MDKQVLDFVTEQTHALIAAPSCCKEAKEAAQSWLAAVGTEKETEETKKYIDERAAQREKELKALPNASKEFVELEMMRIKADVANSYMAYLWYSDLLKDCKTREEGEKVAN